MRAINKLTARGVQTAKGRGYLSDGGGLYLQIAASGAKSWVFRYRDAGRLREMGLGSLQTVSLATARQKALEQRQIRSDGADPIQARAAAPVPEVLTTFRQAADAYVSAHAAGWKSDKHAAQWPSTLEAYAYPIFGDKPVQAIDTPMVMRAIEPIWATKNETATRVRGRIEAILDYATVKGWRAGDNPARWRGHLSYMLPERGRVRKHGHHAALPYTDLQAFMADLRARKGAPARALEFLILTAARTSEVIGMTWDEIDLDRKLWTIPGERMKMGKEHRVPLSEPAIEALKAQGCIPHARVFTMSNMALLMLLRRMGRAGLTAHGFRSTFRDWAAETTDFPAEVAEMALAHAVTDRVEAAYRRGDLFEKRRAIMDAWALACAT